MVSPLGIGGTDGADGIGGTIGMPGEDGTTGEDGIDGTIGIHLDGIAGVILIAHPVDLVSQMQEFMVAGATQ